MYECFHCGHRSVIWDCDFSFEDFCYDGDGIVQILHCTNCGAEIEYRIRFDGEEGHEKFMYITASYDTVVDWED